MTKANANPEKDAALKEGVNHNPFPLNFSTPHIRQLMIFFQIFNNKLL